MPVLQAITAAPIQSKQKGRKPKAVNIDWGVKERLQQGQIFFKLGRGGKRHERFLWVSPDMASLRWRKLGRRGGGDGRRDGNKIEALSPTPVSTSLPFAECQRVVVGRDSGSPERGASKNRDGSACFTLYSHDRYVTFEAPRGSQRELLRDAWVAALAHMIHRTQGLTTYRDVHSMSHEHMFGKTRSGVESGPSILPESCAQSEMHDDPTGYKDAESHRQSRSQGEEQCKIEEETPVSAQELPYHREGRSPRVQEYPSMPSAFWTSHTQEPTRYIYPAMSEIPAPAFFTHAQHSLDRQNFCNPHSHQQRHSREALLHRSLSGSNAFLADQSTQGDDHEAPRQSYPDQNDSSFRSFTTPQRKMGSRRDNEQLSAVSSNSRTVNSSEDRYRVPSEASSHPINPHLAATHPASMQSNMQRSGSQTSLKEGAQAERQGSGEVNLHPSLITPSTEVLPHERERAGVAARQGVEESSIQPVGEGREWGRSSREGTLACEGNGYPIYPPPRPNALTTLFVHTGSLPKGPSPEFSSSPQLSSTSRRHHTLSGSAPSPSSAYPRYSPSQPPDVALSSPPSLPREEKAFTASAERGSYSTKTALVPAYASPSSFRSPSSASFYSAFKRGGSRSQTQASTHDTVNSRQNTSSSFVTSIMVALGGRRKEEKRAEAHASYAPEREKNSGSYAAQGLLKRTASINQQARRAMY